MATVVVTTSTAGGELQFFMRDRLMAMVCFASAAGTSGRGSCRQRDREQVPGKREQ